MSELVDACVALLVAQQVEVAPGLSAVEVADIQGRFGFEFGPDHRELLMQAVPVGERWVDWRHDSDDEIQQRLVDPIEGVLFDVGHGSFWPASWGPRSNDPDEALALAARQLEAWPVLIPLFGHRYLPAAPSSPGAPVFSVVQTDVIYYGSNLLDYLRREFRIATNDSPPVTVEVPPWSLLATDWPGADL